MVKILVLKTKWEDEYVGPIDTPEQLESACRGVVAQRLLDGFWYSEEDDRELAQQVVDGDAPRTWTALRFLQSRSVYEYEQVVVANLTPP